jgi:hypothetical protein
MSNAKQDDTCKNDKDIVQISKKLELTECPICSRSFNEDIIDNPMDNTIENVNNNKIKLECDHEYCKDCIKKWFKSIKTCPMCRSESNMFPDIKATGVDFEFEEFNISNNIDDDDDMTNELFDKMYDSFDELVHKWVNDSI